MSRNTRTRIRTLRFDEIANEVRATANCLELALAAASTNWHYSEIIDAIAGGLRTLRHLEDQRPPPVGKDRRAILDARERLSEVNQIANRKRRLKLRRNGE